MVLPWFRLIFLCLDAIPVLGFNRFHFLSMTGDLQGDRPQQAVSRSGLYSGQSVLPSPQCFGRCSPLLGVLLWLSACTTGVTAFVSSVPCITKPSWTRTSPQRQHRETAIPRARGGNCAPFSREPSSTLSRAEEERRIKQRRPREEGLYLSAVAADKMEEGGPDPKIIDGKATAAIIRAELKEKVTAFSERTGGLAPGLAVVLVGNRRDSATYVRMKKKACDEIGVKSFGFDFAEDVTQDTLLACVRQLNARSDVNGILVQLPLPKHIDEDEVLQAITPSKDVDGLHPENVAALCTGRTRAGAANSWELGQLDFHIPCTPQGCIELLDRYGVQIEGKRAVVLGRSNIVGIPVSMLLMHRDATVTMVHSKTVDAASVVKGADIVVCAVGRPEMVKGDWIKPGAAVIDVGINSVDDSTTKKGYRLVGDVDFVAAKERASKITPVPGGVGPMTIAMLLRNTVNGAIRSYEATAVAGTETASLPPVPLGTAEAVGSTERTTPPPVSKAAVQA